MGDEGASAATQQQQQQQQRQQQEQARQPVAKAGARPAAAAPRDAADISRRCEGTRGTWCSDFHGQTEVPAVTAPRGDLDCSLDCNKVRQAGGPLGSAFAGFGGLLTLSSLPHSSCR